MSNYVDEEGRVIGEEELSPDTIAVGRIAEPERELAAVRKWRLCFVRFGDVPSTMRSTNYLTGEPENGVSVYEAIERDGVYSVLLPNLTASACVSLSGVLDRPMYEVMGAVIGTGSDGEPILLGCEIISHELTDKEKGIADAPKG